MNNRKPNVNQSYYEIQSSFFGCSIKGKFYFFKMFQQNRFILLLFLIYFTLNVYSMQTINVMVSRAEPFVNFKQETNTIDGLDIKLIENFGKKFNFNIKYIRSNESLNVVLRSKNQMQKFLKSKENQCVF